MLWVAAYYDQEALGGIAIDAFKHSVRLSGPDAMGNRLPASMFRNLLDALIAGARGAVRLRFEGRSSAPGAAPSWLAAAADFAVLPLEKGSTVVPLLSAPLAKAAPSQFAQDDLFEPIANRSCLGLFEESLRAALRGDEESELYDQKLLHSFQSFSRFFDEGITSVEIESEEAMDSGAEEAIRIRRPQLDTLERLIRQTPPSQRVRLSGKLDMIRHHDRRFSLQLDSGESVQGIAETVAVEDLRAHFGQGVIVHGFATFQPSGRVLRIEADQIEPVSVGASVFSQMPKPVLSMLDQRSLRSEQGPRSGLNAVFGRWPGDETEEEVAKALAEIS